MSDPSPGDVVSASDGKIRIVSVSVDSVHYHHLDRDKSYVISADSYADYASAGA